MAGFHNVGDGVVDRRAAGRRVEAAYRKELVLGEDDSTRADPLTLSVLFGNIRGNYFRVPSASARVLFGVPGFFWGAGKSGYTLSPFTFNVRRRLGQLEILASEGG